MTLSLTLNNGENMSKQKIFPEIIVAIYFSKSQLNTSYPGMKLEMAFFTTFYLSIDFLTLKKTLKINKEKKSRKIFKIITDFFMNSYFLDLLA
jgi:hypothetical protein